MALTVFVGAVAGVEVFSGRQVVAGDEYFVAQVKYGEAVAGVQVL